MKKTLIATTLVGALALTACGKETVYVVAEPTTTTAPKTTTTVTSRPPSYVPEPGYQEVPNTYDPDAYDTFLWEQVNDFWWLFTRDQLLQMGLIVCEEFDRGQNLDQVSETLVQIMLDTNTPYFMDGLAAVTGAALTFLCPEHSWQLEAI